MRTPPLLAERCRSSVVERILGKAEVGSSILPGSTSVPFAIAISRRGKEYSQSITSSANLIRRSNELWSVASCFVVPFLPA